ncbi:MAG: 3-hydroxyacyl-CoA dehydrogenase NAD-binding domain-containing protein [Blastocatellia bacterium]
MAILKGKLEEGLRHGSDLLSEPSVEGLLLLVPKEDLDALAGQRGPKLDVKGQGAVIVAALNESGAADRFLYQSGGGGSARWALFQGMRQEGLAVAVRALVHVQRSEQLVGKVVGIDESTPRRTIARAAVVGAGTMGSGIALCYANAGIPVLLQDASQEALEAGMARIRRVYDEATRKGRISGEERVARLARIEPVTGYDGFADVEIVTEAVFEGMALKKQIFGELDQVCREGTILASNTSTLSIDEIAGATRRPADVIGHHYFSPAHVMRLLEVVRGAATRPEVLATSLSLGRRLGKLGVVVGNGYGFVGNRMLHQYGREAQLLLEEGALPEQIDRVLTAFGMAMGPFAVGDLAGLDVGWRIRRENAHLRQPGERYPVVADRLCERGRFGQKTGAGWYRYDESRRALPDPEVEALIQAVSAEQGIERRAIPDEEILARTQYALINEGARLLGEGIARRASDIDLVYLHGYGYPAWRGGPMRYAESVGLANILETIREWHDREGERWRPAPLLEELVARQGRSFAEAEGSR